MYQMASCPSKALPRHNPLKSSYDPHTSTNIAVPCINDDTALLFEVETNEIEGIDDDISSQLLLMIVIRTQILPMIPTTMIMMKILIIHRLNLAWQFQRFK
jgi:hypothetical protein